MTFGKAFRRRRSEEVRDDTAAVAIHGAASLEKSASLTLSRGERSRREFFRAATSATWSQTPLVSAACPSVLIC